MGKDFKRRKDIVYKFICDDMYVPMKIKELAIVLGVKKEERPQLEEILLELMAEGKISLSKRGKYTKAEESQLVGVFSAHPKGFGFVNIEGEDEDIFIPDSKVGDALHMDKVQIVISPFATGRRKEGVIVKVLERGMKQIVCTYEESKSFDEGSGFIISTDAGFSIPP